MPQLTREQVESRKAKAVRFVRNVLGDEGRAREIEDESPDDYAERRRIQILNPPRRKPMARSTPLTKAELQDRVAELEQENADLSEQLDAIADIVSPDDSDDDDEDDDSDEDEEN